MSTASANATASSTVPARAPAPVASAAFFACSASRSENMIWCPDFAHRPPNVEPMRPEPMMPIFIGFACASAGSAAAAVRAKRKVRRFMASPSNQAITARIDSMDSRRRAILAAGLALYARRIFPQDTVMLPKIGLGTWQTFDAGNDSAARAPLREVLKLLDGNVVDSSPMYGSSESVAGDLIAELGMRERLFIATK